MSGEALAPTSGDASLAVSPVSANHMDRYCRDLPASSATGAMVTVLAEILTISCIVTFCQPLVRVIHAVTRKKGWDFGSWEDAIGERRLAG